MAEQDEWTKCDVEKTAKLLKWFGNMSLCKESNENYKDIYAYSHNKDIYARCENGVSVSYKATKTLCIFSDCMSPVLLYCTKTKAGEWNCMERKVGVYFENKYHNFSNTYEKYQKNIK